MLAEYSLSVRVGPPDGLSNIWLLMTLDQADAKSILIPHRYRAVGWLIQYSMSDDADTD
jgi:hypothetical protein